MSNPNGEKALVFTWGEESLTRQLREYHILAAEAGLMARMV
jgi:hypothetical protein